LASDAAFACVGSFSNAEAALQKLTALQPELCILDIGLPGMSGIDAIDALRAQAPNLKIILFTVFEDSENIVRAIQKGANGYILKDTEPELLLSELKVVLLGGATLTPKVAQKISQLIPESESQDGSDDSNLLTRRQSEILNLIALGFDGNEIADELDLSAHTVRHHIENIYQRLHVNNRREAIRAGFKFGFLKNLGRWIS
ncbi:MAG: response regulator transcription factor, partial [Spirochaetes bacterium]|nr:response regulator transcription factor [Spirochaetota bacterium]